MVLDGGDEGGCPPSLVSYREATSLSGREIALVGFVGKYPHGGAEIDLDAGMEKELVLLFVEEEVDTDVALVAGGLESILEPSGVQLD